MLEFFSPKSTNSFNTHKISQAIVASNMYSASVKEDENT